MRAGTGPRHAAPRKPLFTRFQMPAGKVIAIAAMPTAVLMGMGFTPTLAQADDHSTSKSLTAEEYQACVEAVTGKDAPDTASPSASASASSSSAEATPSPSASSDTAAKDKTSSSDSGSDDKAGSTASPSASASAPDKTADKAAASAASTPTPSASESSKNPLDPLGVGDAIKKILTPDETASSTPEPSASPSASASTTTAGTSATDTPADTAGKVTKTVEDTTDKVTDTASKAASDATEAAKDTAAAVTESPSPSASSTTDPADCPVATDDTGGVDNSVALPTDPWYLNASSLLLKGADYQGIVKVRTADGTVKKVLKYVISDGTDIGDLHQTVEDKQSGKTYHVQAAAGSTSTIRDGKTIMYTESISGNLLGLIPVTFDPDNPPPLNIPLIYFTKVKVVQAGQFGGTLHVPGLHQYTTG